MMHNFSTMAALVSALNTPPIRRLKRTWEQVGARSIASLEMCERTFDSNKNFNNYRTTLAKIEPPCVPFLGRLTRMPISEVLTRVAGVYLTTLVFINEGSKDIIPPPQPTIVPGQPPSPPPTGPLINFAKRQKAAEVIREIKNWQSKPYNLTSVTVIQSFIEESLNEIKKGKIDEMSDFFWNRSLELEPREREDEKMARLLQESGFL
jgi:son of sevenless